MLLWWHQEQQNEHITLDRVALKHIEKIMRITRRSYYASILYSHRAFTFSNKTIAKAFIHVFPKASRAFQKHDVLTGLETGPSSYFLHSISSTKPDTIKPKTRRKKIVA